MGFYAWEAVLAERERREDAWERADSSISQADIGECIAEDFADELEIDLAGMDDRAIADYCESHSAVTAGVYEKARVRLIERKLEAWADGPEVD